MNAIKPQELRIGVYAILNLNHSDEEIIQINANDILAIYNGGGVYSPAPLTSDWLVKLGFVSDNDKYDPIYENGHVSLMGSGIINDWILRHDSHGIVNIQYLHQLQNGFFIITGEELIIK